MRNWVWLRNEGSEGPGRASSRHVELPNSDPAPLVWRALEGPEGLAAVPVGGGRARAGLEIDHSEPSGSRVAISRAGRRPPAHTAARPFKAGLRRPEHQRGHKHQHAAQTARGRAAAHRHTQRPGLPRQALRRGRRAGGPPPTGTQSDQTELGRSCAVDGGRTEQPGLTQHAAHRTPAVPHSKQNPRNTTKNAHSNASIHSFTATLPKVI